MKLDTSQTCISLKPAEQGCVLLVGAQPSPWQVLSLISGCDVKSLVVVYRAQKVSGKPGQKVKFMELTFFGFPSGKVPGASKQGSPVFLEQNIPKGNCCWAIPHETMKF